jgi:hypothetical protein
MNVKFALPALLLPFVLLSCTPVHEHRAGGASFDDSELAQALDANTALPDEQNDRAARSYQEWREKE